MVNTSGQPLPSHAAEQGSGSGFRSDSDSIWRWKFGVEEMKPSKPILTIFVLFLIILNQAKGVFLYDDYEQNRHIIAVQNRDPIGSLDQKYMDALGHFEETVRMDFINTNSPHPTNLYVVSGGQDSWLMEKMITFQGDCSITDPFYHTELGNLDLSASSYIKSEFMVASSCQVSLTGILKACGDYGGTTGYPKFDTFITLTEEGGTAVFSIILPSHLDSSGCYNWSIDETFELAPHILYILEAKAFIECSYYGSEEPGYDIGGGGQTSIDNFTMIITPEPATVFLFVLGSLIFRERGNKVFVKTTPN